VAPALQQDILFGRGTSVGRAMRFHRRGGKRLRDHRPDLHRRCLRLWPRVVLHDDQHLPALRRGEKDAERRVTSGKPGARDGGVTDFDA